MDAHFHPIKIIKERQNRVNGIKHVIVKVASWSVGMGLFSLSDKISVIDLAITVKKEVGVTFIAFQR